MSDSVRVAYILSLIGGIFGVLISIFTFGIAIFMYFLFKEAARSATSTVPNDIAVFAILLIVSLYFLISAILVIVGATWIKVPEKRMKGAIMVLIFSLFGGGTIFGLIGGIIGLINDKK